MSGRQRKCVSFGVGVMAGIVLRWCSIAPQERQTGRI